MRTINCHNFYHLGDCIQTLHFLIHAARLNNISFDFMCNPEYYSQLKEFIGNDNINLTSNLNEKSIDTWIGAYNYQKICNESQDLYGKNSDQATFFLLFWNIISNLMDIKCPFSQKNHMIYDEETINLDSFHKEKYDYLFINSKNMSIPFPNFEKEIRYCVDKLIKGKKSFITTSKVDNNPCTLDYKMSVIEIARLSKSVKNIIAVNTGPLHLCMNKWTIQNVNSFIVWSPAETFNHGSKFKSVKSLEELDESYF